MHIQDDISVNGGGIVILPEKAAGSTVVSSEESPIVAAVSGGDPLYSGQSRAFSMANPSLKNGYISIANELVEQLARKNIPGGEMRILWVVWRKTWGWKLGDRKKDWDWIAISQFELATEMKHSNVVREVKSLVSKRILLKGEKGLKFNQNYEEWVVSKRIPPVVKRIRGGSQKDTEIGSQKDTNKRKKETRAKETIATNVAVEFSLKEEVQKLEDNPRRDLNIIAFYFEERQPTLTSKDQFNVAIRRHLRAAKQLSPFSDEQIVKASKKAKQDYPEWTLETLVKLVTK